MMMMNLMRQRGSYYFTFKEKIMNKMDRIVRNYEVTQKIRRIENILFFKVGLKHD